MKRLYFGVMLLMIVSSQKILTSTVNPFSSFGSKSPKINTVVSSRSSKKSDSDLVGDDSSGGSDSKVVASFNSSGGSGGALQKNNSINAQPGSQRLSGTQGKASGKTVQPAQGSVDLSSFAEPAQQEVVQGKIVAIGSQLSAGAPRGTVIKIQPPQPKKSSDQDVQNIQTSESNAPVDSTLNSQQTNVSKQATQMTAGAKDVAKGYAFKKVANKKGKEITTLEIPEKDKNGNPVKNADGTIVKVKLDISSLSKSLKTAKTPENVKTLISEITGKCIQDPAVMKLLQEDPEFKQFQSEVATKVFKPTSLDNAMFMMKTVTSFITEASYGKVGKKMSEKTTKAISAIPIGIQKKHLGYQKNDQIAKTQAGIELDEVNANNKSSSEEKNNARLKYEAASKKAASEYMPYRARQAANDISNFIRENKQKLLSKLESSETSEN